MSKPEGERSEGVGLVPIGRSAFVVAARDTLSVGFALAPIGVAFGLLLVQSGFEWWWAPLFSTLIYAGSLEFLAVGLILAVTPLAQVALTTFLVNFRHVFYALSFPLRSLRTVPAKVYGMYALTDEAYALTVSLRSSGLNRARILWIQVFCQFYWVAGGVVGALLATMIPGPIVGIDFALTALFVVLTIDAFRDRKDVPVAVVALVCALVAMVFTPDAMLVAAMGSFVVVLLGRYFWSRRCRVVAGVK